MKFFKTPLVVFLTVGFFTFAILIFSPRIAVQEVLLPVKKISISLQLWFQGIQHASELKASNLSYQEKLTELEALKLENEQLQATLNFVENEQNTLIHNTSKKIYAKVVRAIQPYQENLLLIDIGKNDGVVVGNIVGSYGNFIGEIDTVYAHTSIVRVAIYEDAQYAVHLSEDIQAIIQGTYDGNHFLMSTIPQNFEIQKRTLVTLAQTKSFPHRAPLIVGEIQKITPIPEEPFQSGEVVPLLPTTEIRHVMVYL